MGLLITNMLSFKLSPDATGRTKSASLQSTQQKERPFFKGALVHISQPLRENEERRDSPILVGYTKGRSFLSPKYTKGPFQIQATK